MGQNQSHWVLKLTQTSLALVLVGRAVGRCLPLDAVVGEAEHQVGIGLEESVHPSQGSDLVLCLNSSGLLQQNPNMNALCQRETYSPNFEGQKVQNQSVVIRVGPSSHFRLWWKIWPHAAVGRREKGGRKHHSFLL